MLENVAILRRLFAMSLCLLSACLAAAPSGYVLTLDGAIGPASADYVVRGIGEANDSGAALVILNMNTPGGLDKSMRQIIRAILASDTPVATYVSPAGARAASAGTYILIASHIAAMAPATNVGAATPVQIGAPGLTPPQTPEPSGQPDSGDEPGKAGKSSGSTMDRKVINDASAYIQSLAELRGRNVSWAVKSVRGSESLSSRQALDMGVIDLIADNIEDLLRQLHDRQVSSSAGETTLSTDNMTLRYYQPDWRNKFLSVIADPSVAYILLLIGIYGLVLEFYNPGGGIAGVIGGICLFIALYALQILPISYTGLALMLLGLALMIAEAMSPSFGFLGIGGVIAFTFGSVMLIDTDLPAFQIALPIILAITALSALLMIFVVGMIWRARHAPLVSGLAPLVGITTEVVSIDHGHPFIHLQGENWQVQCSQPLQVGDRVRVTEARGLTLNVEKEQ